MCVDVYQLRPAIWGVRLHCLVHPIYHWA